MDRQTLQSLWQKLFNRPPSAQLRREVMIPFLAYRIQEIAYGGLKESIERRLREVAESSNREVKPTIRSKSGTRYVREHNGKLHEVTVLDEGFEYEGSTYRSLTEIAKVITGAKWSGPAFFGLKRRARSGVA
jgi:histone H3/H4